MMGQRLAALEKNYKRVDRSITTINTHLDVVETFADTRFNTIDTRFNTIDTRFNTIDTRLNANEMYLNKTTKVFQKRLDNLDARLNQLCDNVDTILMMLKQAEVKNKNKANIDFDNGWKLCEPSEEFDLYQNDQHSCGVHLLTQAKAYINREQHKAIPQDEINLYRHQIAEEILR
ncbi:unnamed protein product [Rotaria sordida]|uniref:Uncharacterized protein n=1 Tax=Rotaria sordida TaxID=392033 RepID=A0A814RM99_9BILA|nr:unnamed protein product [Rotaria sordida]CAF1360108.1 unnamed protein product [Rotaria sordida]